MAEIAGSVYGRRTRLDNLIDGVSNLVGNAGSAAGTAIASAVPATKKAIRGIAGAFDNTLGNNGPGGSGAPTYVDDPYSVAPATAVPAIAKPSVIPQSAVPQAIAGPADNGVGVGFRDPAKVVPLNIAGPAAVTSPEPRTPSPEPSTGTVNFIPAIATPPAAQQNTLQQATDSAPQPKSMEHYKREAERLAPALWTDKAGQANQMVIAGNMLAADQAKNKTFVDQQRGIADVGLVQQKVNNDQQEGIANIDAHRYGSDQHLAGTKVTAEAHVKGAEIGAEGRERAAVAAHANDQGKQSKENQKAHLDYAEKFLQDSGAERSPENMASALTFSKNYGDYNRKADAFIDKLPENARTVWADILRRNREGKLTQEESGRYASHLAQQGLLEFPKRPVFAPKQLGMIATGEK